MDPDSLVRSASKCYGSPTLLKSPFEKSSWGFWGGKERNDVLLFLLPECWWRSCRRERAAGRWRGWTSSGPRDRLEHPLAFKRRFRIYRVPYLCKQAYDMIKIICMGTGRNRTSSGLRDRLEHPLASHSFRIYISQHHLYGNQCCGSGSGGSVCFWASGSASGSVSQVRIRLRILPLLSKNSKKNLNI